MSTLTISTARGAGPADRAGARAVLPGLVGHVRREFAYWRARRAMGQLSEEALHDMGVGRSEIDDAIRHGRPR